MDRREFLLSSAAGVFLADPKLWAAVSAGGAMGDVGSAVGQPVNLAAYGNLQSWLNPAATRVLQQAQSITKPASAGPLQLAPLAGTDGQIDFGVEWPDAARTIDKIVLEYAAADTMPPAGTYVLEYWNGATIRQGKWRPFDDSTTQLKVEGKTWTFSFPVHRTNRVRVRLQQPAQAALARLAVYGSATWKSGQVRVEWGHRGEKQSYDGRLETYNGEVLQLTPVGTTRLTGPLSWTSAAGSGRIAGIEATVLYTSGPPVDRSILTLRTAGCEVSFLPGEALEREPIDIPDAGVYVRPSASPLSRAAYRRQNADKFRIMDAVARRPEQTMEEAYRAGASGWRTVLAFIGVDSNNHKFGVAPDGHFSVSYGDPSYGNPLLQLYDIHFGVTEQPAQDAAAEPAKISTKQQSLEEGWLPIITTIWQGRALTLERTDYGVLQNAPPSCDESTLTGTEPALLISRLKIRNQSTEPRIAGYDIIHENTVAAPRGGNIVTATPPLRKAEPTGEYNDVTYLVCYVDMRGRGTLALGKDNAIRYSLRLEPGEEHTLYTVVPAEPLTLPESRRHVVNLHDLPYESLQESTAQYWKSRLAEGMQVQVPDQHMQNIWQANLHHWLLVLTKDQRRNEYYPNTAPHCYGVIETESSPLTQVLDMRGMHRRAELCINPFLSTQGDTPPIGEYALDYPDHPGVPVDDPMPVEGYTSLKGGFYHFWPSYTAGTGEVLWTMAEHYLYTGDIDWLRRVAPQIIAGCDFIIEARKSTKHLLPNGDKPIAYGLAPAGCAFDQRDQEYAFMLNAYFYLGLKKSAQVLRDVDSQQAARIAEAAADYLQEIRRALKESIIRAPVVRLRDNTSVNCVPPYADLRSPATELNAFIIDEGWGGTAVGIADPKLEKPCNYEADFTVGALHLINGQVIDPNGPEATAMLNYLEDVIFTPDGPDWFNTGGFMDVQSYYCHNQEAYLRRDQIPNFLRAFFNTLAIFSDAQTLSFSECVRGSYMPNKTHEEGWFMMQFRYLLLMEQDEDLILARATPRVWLEDGKEIIVRRAPSYFGELSYEIHSAVEQGRIEAVVRPPQRRQPANLYLRLRHPTQAPLKRVIIGGSEWKDLDVEKEWITLPRAGTEFKLVAYY